MRIDFKSYKVDMKYIHNLHNIDDKVLPVSSQTRKPLSEFSQIRTRMREI